MLIYYFHPVKIESFIRALAGTVILISLALAHFLHPGWLFLTAFAGANLLQSAFTGFCPPSLVLRKLGWVGEDGTIHWGCR
jgi:hypothetical protein